MKVCVSGCICKEGFVRASKSRDYCVPTEDCDAELRKSIAKSNVKNRAGQFF